MRVLHVDASARWNRSHTRRLSALFVEELRKVHSDIAVVRRDLAASPPPPVNEHWIAAAFAKGPQRTPEMQDALLVSDELVNELLACDLYVFGVPMYNYSVPSVFKSYIDQIVRVGRTFSFNPERPQPYRGLIEGKRLVLITARGESGYGPDGPHWRKNHLEPYVSEVFEFLGVEQIHAVAVENDEFGGSALRDSIRAAEISLAQLALEIETAVCCGA